MNEEQRIAHAIILAQDMYAKKKSKSLSKCFQRACQMMMTSPHLWMILYFANHWNNDLRNWADGILE